MTYSPTEKRDEHGRWTAGGAASVNVVDAGNREHGEELAAKATAVATDLGYDPKLISITDQDKTFELNGKTYDYAGAAHITGPDKGKIELFANKIDDKTVNEVTAHEIGHQKFQDYLDFYKVQRDFALEEPGPEPDPNGESYWQRRGGSMAVMSADGILREPYASKYPVYQEYEKIMQDAGGIDGFAKSDGITDYSRQWWDAWKQGKARTDQAMHETIAEMTARDFVLGPSEDEIRDQFKKAGYSLDSSSSEGRTTYSVRKWKGRKTLDEAELPHEIQKGLVYLRKNEIQKRFGMTSKYAEPAPEWKALYNAVNKHWQEQRND